MQRGILIIAGLMLAIPAAADHTLYHGWDGRQIKGLSDGQIEDLRTGRGMGLALPAELNGYPGPRHVLDLAGELELTTQQRAQAQHLFDEMAEQAVVLGEQLITAEAALDRLFAEKQASEDSVRSAALELGQLQGELRGHHLSYHLATRELLSPHQVMRYQQLRGYDEGSPGHHAGHGDGEVR